MEGANVFTRTEREPDSRSTFSTSCEPPSSSKPFEHRAHVGLRHSPRNAGESLLFLERELWTNLPGPKGTLGQGLIASTRNGPLGLTEKLTQARKPSKLKASSAARFDWRPISQVMCQPRTWSRVAALRRRPDKLLPLARARCLAGQHEWFNHDQESCDQTSKNLE